MICHIKQLELSMKAKEDDIQVKWSLIHNSETNIEVKPFKVQEVCLFVCVWLCLTSTSRKKKFISFSCLQCFVTVALGFFSQSDNIVQ